MKVNYRRYLISNWKLEDLGFTKSSNSKGRERRQVKKKARNEFNSDFGKE